MKVKLKPQSIVDVDSVTKKFAESLQLRMATTTEPATGVINLDVQTAHVNFNLQVNGLAEVAISGLEFLFMSSSDLVGIRGLTSAGHLPSLITPFVKALVVLTTEASMGDQEEQINQNEEEDEEDADDEDDDEEDDEEDDDENQEEEEEDENQEEKDEKGLIGLSSGFEDVVSFLKYAFPIKWGVYFDQETRARRINEVRGFIIILFYPHTTSIQHQKL